VNVPLLAQMAAVNSSWPSLARLTGLGHVAADIALGIRLARIFAPGIIAIAVTGTSRLDGLAYAVDQAFVLGALLVVTASRVVFRGAGHQSRAQHQQRPRQQWVQPAAGRQPAQRGVRSSGWESDNRVARWRHKTARYNSVKTRFAPRASQGPNSRTP
jgi:hypothetical protein